MTEYVKGANVDRIPEWLILSLTLNLNGLNAIFKRTFTVQSFHIC